MAQESFIYLPEHAKIIKRDGYFTINCKEKGEGFGGVECGDRVRIDESVIEVGYVRCPKCNSQIGIHDRSGQRK